MTADSRFELFKREYNAWHEHTQALPLRLDRSSDRGTFEVDLDHLIDCVQSILAAAAERSTQFDYPMIASEYLHDLDQTEAELHSVALADAARQAYSEYLAEFRHLLSHLGSRPVPSEGHLGFRKYALQAFRFLIVECSFEIAGTSPIAVRLTTDAMFLDLSYSPECPMNSILVGTRTSDRAPSSTFILDDFAYVAGRGILFDYGRFDLQDPVGIAAFLHAAATLLHQYGHSLLSGDAEAFREFRNKADEREQSYVELMERQRSAQQ